MKDYAAAVFLCAAIAAAFLLASNPPLATLCAYVAAGAAVTWGVATMWGWIQDRSNHE